eukprot:PLAT767.1.p1 GENE.PLAT767.1~~PLAT767.1.p1  ORF type:complete len:275 (+),score=54.40 PLAT767.1:121-945(+)
MARRRRRRAILELDADSLSRPPPIAPAEEAEAAVSSGIAALSGYASPDSSEEEEEKGDWRLCKTKEGADYYWQVSTGRVQWSAPASFASADESDDQRVHDSIKRLTALLLRVAALDDAPADEEARNIRTALRIRKTDWQAGGLSTEYFEKRIAEAVERVSELLGGADSGKKRSADAMTVEAASEPPSKPKRRRRTSAKKERQSARASARAARKQGSMIAKWAAVARVDAEREAEERRQQQERESVRLDEWWAAQAAKDGADRNPNFLPLPPKRE